MGVFAILLAATILLLAATRRRLLLFVMDPPMASVVGMRVGRWALFESLWLGLAVGLSIRATGMNVALAGLLLLIAWLIRGMRRARLSG